MMYNVNVLSVRNRIEMVGMVLVVAFDTSFASSVAYLLSFVSPPVLIPSSSALLPLHEMLPVLHSGTS